MSEGSVGRTEEDLLRHKPVFVFGKDITEIKCFRDSFICGICTSAAGGLGTFLFTSKALFSTHIAFVSLWVGVFAYWIPCRHKYESEIMLYETLKKRQEEKFKMALEEEKKMLDNELKNEE